ncbi:MAG: hypothetical protein Q9187_000910 [Circinaria calcarea]
MAGESANAQRGPPRFQFDRNEKEFLGKTYLPRLQFLGSNNVNAPLILCTPIQCLNHRNTTRTPQNGLHPERQLPRNPSRTRVSLLSSPLPPKRSSLQTNSLQSALETFYGIGPQHSQRIMARFHIHPMAKVGSLANKQIFDLTAELSGMHIENDLRREVRDNIRRLRDMGAYRGRRHAQGLPVRGQKTRTQVCVSKGAFGKGGVGLIWCGGVTECDGE